MWNRRKVTVVFPTYREKKSIYNAIMEFRNCGFIDEIIVVDNNAEKGTEQEVKKTKAIYIKEKKQGFGKAIRTGIANSKSSIIIIAEPDNTFKGKDVAKLLSYSDDFEMVFGSRTHVPLIEKKSKMSFIRRMSDVFLGKLISLLFLCPPLTDVGCIFRLTTRKAWNKISYECKANGAIFATQWQISAAKNKINFVEIPVNFRHRIGKSSITESSLDQLYWGIKIFLYIWKSWIYKNLNKKLP